MSDVEATAGQGETRCAECGTNLTEGVDRQVTDDSVFCRPCFNNLTQQIQQVVAAQTKDINYPMAVVGGLLGAAIGVMAWWGFTVVTSISFGLIAVVIGITVGKGVTILSGHKRGPGLQALSIGISALAFLHASYLVNRTFIHRAWIEEGQEGVLPLLPDPALFVRVVTLGFGLMDVVFLGIVLYEAWKIPAALKITDE